MPSIKKQKAKEKRSWQSDVISDLETMDLMLNIFPGNVSGNNCAKRIVEANSESKKVQESTITLRQNFRSLLNSYSSELLK